MLTVVRHARNFVAVEDGANVLRVFRGRKAWNRAKQWAWQRNDCETLRIVRLPR